MTSNDAIADEMTLSETGETQAVEAVKFTQSQLGKSEWFAALMFTVSLLFMVLFPTTGALAQMDASPDGSPNPAWFPVFWTTCGLLLANFTVFFFQDKRGRPAMLFAIGFSAIVMALLLDWWYNYHLFMDAVKP